MEGGVMEECEASADVLLSDTMDQYRTFQMCERLLYSPAKLGNQLLFQIPPHLQATLVERYSIYAAMKFSDVLMLTALKVHRILSIIYINVEVFLSIFKILRFWWCFCPWDFGKEALKRNQERPWWHQCEDKCDAEKLQTAGYCILNFTSTVVLTFLRF